MALNMYKSPVKLIVDDFMQTIRQQQNDAIFKAVQNCGVDVDKEELIKALNYDREQYSKGYNDGYADGGKKGYRNGVFDFAKYLEEHSFWCEPEGCYGFEAIDIDALRVLIDEFFKKVNMYEM